MAWLLGYTVLPLPTGYTASYAYAVSGDGTVVVGEADDADGNYHATYWTKALADLNESIDIGDLGGGWAYAIATNSDGSVIVGYSNNGSVNRGFRWTSGTGMVEMQPLPENTGGTTGAAGVSADGSVVVGTAIDADFNQQAVKWDALGTVTGLGFLPGGLRSVALSASSDGSVIVGYGDATDTNIHAVRWTDLGMDDLGFQLGGSYSQALAVSADGSVIVGEGDDSSFNAHPFRWTAIDGMVDLGLLPGGSWAFATGVSDDGNTVVGIGDNSSGQERVWTWTQADGMVVLPDLSGVSSTDSYDGNWIAGNGSVVVGEAPILYPFVGYHLLPIHLNDFDIQTTSNVFPSGARYLLISMWTAGGGPKFMLDIQDMSGATPTGVFVDFEATSYAFDVRGGAILPGPGNNIIVDVSGTAGFDIGCQSHLLISVDLVAEVLQIYICDQEVTPGGIGFQVSRSMPATTTAMVLRQTTQYYGGGANQAYVGDVWLDTPASFVDLSIEANRRLFINGDLTPVDLGDDGSLPFGTIPRVYHSLRDGDTADDWLTNRGAANSTLGTLPGYVPNVVHDLGYSTILHNGPRTIFSSPVDSFIVSFWLYSDTNIIIFDVGDEWATFGDLLRIELLHGTSGTNACSVEGYQGFTLILNADFNPLPAVSDNCACHYLLSVKLSTSQIQLYTNDADSGVPLGSPVWNSPSAIPFDAATGFVQWNDSLSHVSDIWWGSTADFVDLSITSNRRKFINVDLTPVDLGVDGSGPFGTAPEIYQTVRPGGVATDWLTNRGTAGGTYTILENPDHSFGTVSLDGNPCAVPISGTYAADGNPCDPGPVTTAFVYGLLSIIPSNITLPRVVIYF